MSTCVSKYSWIVSTHCSVPTSWNITENTLDSKYLIALPLRVLIVQVKQHKCTVCGITYVLHTYSYNYRETCIIRHPLGNEKQCWIVEVSLDGKINGWCQRVSAGLCKYWLMEVLDYAGSAVQQFTGVYNTKQYTLLAHTIHVHSMLVCKYAAA